MNPEAAQIAISLFIRNYFARSKRKFAVIGLSGGLDSAVALFLCVRALGKRNVLAVLMPSKATPKSDMNDARALARKLGVKSATIKIEPILRPFGGMGKEKLSRANLSARVRMALLYSIAQKKNGLVIGTGDKSELLLGYFTKHGDGAADLFPIGGLYKTQVRILGAYLGLPLRILEKPPSPALWVGQTAEKELGFSYADADIILEALQRGEEKGRIVAMFGKKKALAVLSRVEKNHHKIATAPVCNP